MGISYYGLGDNLKKKSEYRRDVPMPAMCGRRESIAMCERRVSKVGFACSTAFFSLVIFIKKNKPKCLSHEYYILHKISFCDIFLF